MNLVAKKLFLAGQIHQTCFQLYFLFAKEFCLLLNSGLTRHARHALKNKLFKKYH
jgi:hypothetical protein